MKLVSECRIRRAVLPLVSAGPIPCFCKVAVQAEVVRPFRPLALYTCDVGSHDISGMVVGSVVVNLDHPARGVPARAFDIRNVALGNDDLSRIMNWARAECYPGTERVGALAVTPGHPLLKIQAIEPWRCWNAPTILPGERVLLDVEDMGSILAHRFVGWFVGVELDPATAVRDPRTVLDGREPARDPYTVLVPGADGYVPVQGKELVTDDDPEAAWASPTWEEP